MIHFKVSAPGKLILFGEHSVVYEKIAIASSLNLRTTLTFTELAENETNIILKMPKENLNVSIPILKIESSLAQNIKEPEDFRQSINRFVDLYIPYETNSQKSCLNAVMFLLINIFQSNNVKNIKPFKISVETELLVGAGLGSSASFAVCLASCFLHYCNVLSNKITLMGSEFLETVSNHAYNCETIFHEKPSGIDNSVCTYGNVIEFIKNKPVVNLPITKTEEFPGIRVMLIGTKVKRSTKDQVNKVVKLREQFPEVVNAIFDSMNEVAKSAKQFLQPDCMKQDCEEYQRLSQLIDINQGLLSTLGVSHETIDQICKESKKFGFSAKLTGAGGGGFVYILIPHDAEEAKIEDLSNTLKMAGFEVLVTFLGSDGVEIQ